MTRGLRFNPSWGERQRMKRKAKVMTTRPLPEIATTARAALEQIKAVCAENDGDDCDHRLALRFVQNVAARALIEQPAGVPTSAFAVMADHFGMKRHPPSVPGVERDALEKIAGIREYSPEDHANASRYKPDEGAWTTDEYLADRALALIEQPMHPEQKRIADELNASGRQRTHRLP